MTRAFIALGSNLGDRFGTLSEAVRRLGGHPGVTLIALAPIIETPPVGGPPQPPYLNTALAVDTSLSPPELLALTRSIEAALGRVRDGERCSPRTIDLDILFYGQDVIALPDLAVPHPRLQHRRFVLEPLAELAPDYVHPVLSRTVRELLAALPSDAAADSQRAESALASE